MVLFLGLGWGEAGQGGRMMELCTGREACKTLSLKLNLPFPEVLCDIVMKLCVNGACAIAFWGNPEAIDFEG